MQIPRQSNKGFFGDLVGSILPTLGSLGGAAAGGLLGGIGAPVGGAAGGFLGGKLGDLARRLPFKRGGRVPKAKGAKPKRMVKGSAAAKAYMAKIRKMKK
jgi:hypothetical protein